MRVSNHPDTASLPLVISKRLTEFYKGEFIIESEKEKGSRVIVRLPLATEADLAADTPAAP